MVGGGLVLPSAALAHQLTHVKIRGVVFDSTGGECSAAQVLPLICHIIMLDMDEVTIFA
jgi:hypothetical protein